MKKKLLPVLLMMVSFIAHAQQRIIAECMLNYSITVEDTTTDKDVIESLRASTKTVYIKANNSRVDLVSPSFKQSLIYDKNSGGVVILREFGNNKFLTKMDAAKWVTANKRYEGMQIVYTNETKTILGYECKKALLQLKDGTTYTVFYAGNIIPSVKEFEYEFKDIPGFVLEYEAVDEANKKIRYTATKINMNPVPVSKFETPGSGYRILNN